MVPARPPAAQMRELPEGEEAGKKENGPENRQPRRRTPQPARGTARRRGRAPGRCLQNNSKFLLTYRLFLYITPAMTLAVTPSTGTPAGSLPRRPGSRSRSSVRSVDGFGVQRFDAALDFAWLDPPAGDGQKPPTWAEAHRWRVLHFDHRKRRNRPPAWMAGGGGGPVIPPSDPMESFFKTNPYDRPAES